MEAKLREQIIQLLQDKEVGASPAYLAKILDKNQRTVQSAMGRMAKDGQLIANYGRIKGNYGLSPGLQKSNHGLPSIKAQNLHFVAEINKDIKDTFVEEDCFPDRDNPIYKIKTVIAKTSSKVTISFSSSIGFGIDALIIGLNYKVKSINSLFGLSLCANDFAVNNLELFTDYFGYGLSKNQIFFSDLQSSLLKIYDKNGKVRIERRSSVPIPLEIFLNIANNEPILTYVNQNKQILDKVDKIEKNFGGVSKTVSYYFKRIMCNFPHKNATNAMEVSSNDFRSADKIK